MSGPATTRLAQLTIRAETQESRRACGWLAAQAEAHRMPPDAASRLDHCLDEALANVIAHGGPAARASPVDLQFAVQRADGACTAELILLYEGVPFDPSRHAVRSKPANLADAQLGGLGLLMLRQFSDAIEYGRAEGRNRLRIVVNWNEPA